MNNTDRYDFEVPGAKISIRMRSFDSPREYFSNPRMYVWADEKFDLIEDLENRRRRPYTIYKKILRSLPLQGIIDLERLSWSQYAGCSCGCSPGFIINHQYQTLPNGKVWPHVDVFVTLTGAPTVDESKPGRFVAV